MINSRRVGIFRHTHLKRSEQFIVGQSSALRRYEPLLLARDPVSNPPASFRSLTNDSPVMAKLYRAGVTRSIRSFLQRYELDVLHAHFGVEGSFVRSAAHSIGLPLVVTLHGYDVLWTDQALRHSLKPSLVAYAHGRRSLFADEKVQFVAVSRFLADRAIGRGLPSERVTVVPTGVDVSSIAPTILPIATRIVHVARLVDFKGTEDLISAFEGVRRALPDARLDIVGDGPLRSQLAAQVRALRLAGAVTFHGALPHQETLALIAKARVLCLPSRTVANGATEGLGQVTLEAMALGRLVVATRTGGIPEAVAHESSGFLVDERRPDQLASMLISVLSEVDGVAVAKEARRLVEQHFDVRKQATIVESIYDKAMGC